MVRSTRWVSTVAVSERSAPMARASRALVAPQALAAQITLEGRACVSRVASPVHHLRLRHHHHLRSRRRCLCHPRRLFRLLSLLCHHCPLRCPPATGRFTPPRTERMLASALPEAAVLARLSASLQQQRLFVLLLSRTSTRQQTAGQFRAVHGARDLRAASSTSTRPR